METENRVRRCKVTLVIRVEGIDWNLRNPTLPTKVGLDQWICKQLDSPVADKKLEIPKVVVESEQSELLPELTDSEMSKIRAALIQSEGEEDCIGRGASVVAMGIVCERFGLSPESTIEVLRSIREEIGSRKSEV